MYDWTIGRFKFETSILRFFRRLLQKMSATMGTFRVFPHFLLKFKPFEELFASQNVIANLCVCVASVCVGVCVCVYVHIHEIKTSLKLSLALFFSALFKR